MASESHQETPSARSRLKSSLVSLVKGPRARLPSLTGPRKSLSGHRPSSPRASDQFPQSDRQPSVEIVQVAGQNAILPKAMDLLEQLPTSAALPAAILPIPDISTHSQIPMPPASQRTRSTPSPSTRSSGAISEFDSEASSDQYAELAKLSFSAWARRRNSSTSSSRSLSPCLPRYPVDFESVSNSSDANNPDPSPAMDSIIAQVPTPPMPFEDSPPNSLPHGSLATISAIVQSTIHERPSEPVSESPKPQLRPPCLGPKSEMELPETSKNKLEEPPTSASPTDTIIPRRDPFPPVCNPLQSLQQTVGGSEVPVHSEPRHEPATSDFPPPKSKEERNVKRSDGSQKINDSEPEKHGRALVPQDSDSDSGSDRHTAPIPLPSLTLSVFRHLFDPRLSWTRKLGCVAATLAINLFLPFVNGVMLGFGEIAAREFIGRYFGWGPLRDLYWKKLKEDEFLVVGPGPMPAVPLSANRSRWWEPANQGLVQRT